MDRIGIGMEEGCSFWDVGWVVLLFFYFYYTYKTHNHSQSHSVWYVCVCAPYFHPIFRLRLFGVYNFDRIFVLLFFFLATFSRLTSCAHRFVAVDMMLLRWWGSVLLLSIQYPPSLGPFFIQILTKTSSFVSFRFSSASE